MKLTLALGLLVAASARATTMIALDLKDLTERAERVVLATVESSEAHWTPDHKAIYTDVTVRVTRVYKGDAKAGETMVVRREGGSVEGIAMKVFGAPAFTPGEEVVVFTEWRGAARYVVGMAQGKLRVVVKDGKRWVNAPDMSEVKTLPGSRILEAKMRSLDDFENQVRIFTRGVK